MNPKRKNNAHSKDVEAAHSKAVKDDPTLPAKSKNTWLLTALCLALALITLAVYGQTLRFGFVNYDDSAYVYENSVVQNGLTWAGVHWAFTYGEIGHWHPLTWLTHMLDCQIYGLNAGGHHLTNVLLHIASVITLFLVLRRMTGYLWRSAFVAAVFAVHPLHVESVAWVSERKDVLSGLFFMLTLWAYVGYVRAPGSKIRYVTVVVFFALGLLSKNMLVTLPFVLLLLDYWPLKRFSDFTPGTWLRLVVEKIPLFVLVAASCLATFLVPEKLDARMHLPFVLRVENALVSYVTYLWQMVYPSGLSCLYPNPTHLLRLWQVAGALGLLLGITGVVYVFRKKFPWLIVGWLWYLGMMIPVIGFVQISFYAHADRYTYLPEIGVYIAITWMAVELGWKWLMGRVVLGSLMVGLLAVLMACAWKQTGYWKNSEMLWNHALAVTPNNIYAHLNLGAALHQDGKTGQAIIEYEKLLEIDPSSAVAYNNLGNVLGQNGHADEAILDYQKALTINPNYSEAWNNLGLALAQNGHADEAILDYQKALAIDPDFDQADNNLGNCLLQKGQVDEAIIRFQKAVAINPNYYKAWNSLGSALAQNGRMDEAIIQFQKAVAINPNYYEAWNNLGLALAQKGQADEAIVQFQKALEIAPNFGQAHNNLGNCLLQKGRVDEAIIQFQKAVAINPNYYKAWNNLGDALAQEGQLDKAIIQFQKALAIDPDYAQACNNLGNCLLQKGQIDGAIINYQKALAIDPEYSEACNNLGDALTKEGQVNQAIVEYQRALALQPGFAPAQNSLNRIAWVLATSPNPSLRNGAEAVGLAQQADRLNDSGNPMMAATLAAADAETGNFAEAITNVQRAIQLASSQKDSAIVQSLQAQLKCYQAGSPFRDSVMGR